MAQIWLYSSRNILVFYNYKVLPLQYHYIGVHFNRFHQKSIDMIQLPHCYNQITTQLLLHGGRIPIDARWYVYIYVYIYIYWSRCYHSVTTWLPLLFATQLPLYYNSIATRWNRELDGLHLSTTPRGGEANFMIYKCHINSHGTYARAPKTPTPQQHWTPPNGMQVLPVAQHMQG